MFCNKFYRQTMIFQIFNENHVLVLKLRENEKILFFFVFFCFFFVGVFF